MSSPEDIYSIPCKQFINGYCKRENKGGCPYVHDHYLRKDNLEKKRFQASRAQLQKNYTQHTTGAKLPSKTSSVSSTLCKYFIKGNCRYVDCRFSHDENHRKATLEKVKLNTLSTANPQQTPVTPPVLQQTKIDSGAKEFCTLYTNGHFCKYQNTPKGCRYVHDLAARRETLAKLENILAAKSEVQSTIPQQERSETSIPKPLQIQNSRPRETCRNFNLGIRCHKTPCPFLHVQAKGASNKSEKQIEPAKAAKLTASTSLQTGSPEDHTLAPVDSGHSSEHVEPKNYERVAIKSNLRMSNDNTEIMKSVEEVKAANRTTPTKLPSGFKKSYTPRQLDSRFSSNLFERMINEHITESQPTKDSDEVKTEDEKLPTAAKVDQPISDTHNANTKELPDTTEATEPSSGTQQKKEPTNARKTKKKAKFLRQKDRKVLKFRAAAAEQIVEPTKETVESAGAQVTTEATGTNKTVKSTTESPREVVEQADETLLIDVSIPETGSTIQFIPECPHLVSKWLPIPFTSTQQILTENVPTTSWGMTHVVEPDTIDSTTYFPALGSNDSPLANSYVTSWNAQELAIVRRPPSIASKSTTTTPNGSFSSDSKSKASSRPSQQRHWDAFEITRWARENLKPSEINPYLSKFPGVPLLDIPYHLIASEKQSPAKIKPKQRTFHPFGQLPTEIRLQIWKLAVDNEVSHIARIRIKHKIVGEETLNRFEPRTRPPALLHASTESRSLALQRWKLSFGTATARGYTYFDFNTDRVFLHTRNSNELLKFVQYLNPREASRVRFLSLPLRDGANNLVNGEFARCISAFKNIKTVGMAIGDGQEDIEYWGPKKERHEDKLKHKIAPWWWGEHGLDWKAPMVKIYTIPALRAKKWGINGIFWA